MYTIGTQVVRAPFGHNDDFFAPAVLNRNLSTAGCLIFPGRLRRN